MITEDYVSFETAKLLKEKEFNADVNCTHVYVYGRVVSKDYFRDINELEEHVQAPTIQVAMKWLREVHNIAIETEWEHLWYAYIKPMTSKPSEEDYYQCESSKYEEACEAAIKYCLENLI